MLAIFFYDFEQICKKQDRILGNPTLSFQVTHRHNLYKYTGISVFNKLFEKVARRVDVAFL